jgi:hypothetical protein
MNIFSIYSSALRVTISPRKKSCMLGLPRTSKRHSYVVYLMMTLGNRFYFFENGTKNPAGCEIIIFYVTCPAMTLVENKEKCLK